MFSDDKYDIKLWYNTFPETVHRCEVPINDIKIWCKTFSETVHRCEVAIVFRTQVRGTYTLHNIAIIIMWQCFLMTNTTLNCDIIRFLKPYTSARYLYDIKLAYNTFSETIHRCEVAMVFRTQVRGTYTLHNIAIIIMWQCFLMTNTTLNYGIIRFLKPYTGTRYL